MESQYRNTTEGQELGQEDVNLLGETSALADDRTLAELLRVLPYDGSTVSRGILPYAGHAASTGLAADGLGATVRGSGSANGKVVVQPFRAVIGARSSSTDLLAWRDIRSAVQPSEVEVQLSATSSSNRWDLVYARVDVEIDEASVTRYVRDASGNTVGTSVVVAKHTTVTIGTVTGVEGATPTRPAIPSDAGGAYYIPLAYVALTHPHTTSSEVVGSQILEAAPMLGVSPATGAVTLAPANQIHVVGGILLTARPWTPTAGRPGEFLPPTMVGGASVLLPLDLESATKTIALGGAAVVDNSRDWRYRLFQTTIVAASGTNGFPWEPAAGGVGATWLPDPARSTLGNHLAHQTGQSFRSSAAVAHVTSSVLTQVASGADLLVYVDMTTGALCASVGATNPACRLLLWIAATGQHTNA
jgi:hypothetical protein